jgi:hypothetical protein
MKSLRMFENRLRGKIFRSEKDKVTGEWRIAHNEELNYLYFSPTIIRLIKSRRRWAGNVPCVGGRRGAYRTMVRKSEGKKPLKRPGRGWEYNIKMEIKWVWVMDWIDLPSGELLRMSLRVLQNRNIS